MRPYKLELIFSELILIYFFRGLLLLEEPLFHNCAVESLMFYSPLTSTSSRINKSWPRWDNVDKLTDVEKTYNVFISFAQLQIGFYFSSLIFDLVISAFSFTVFFVASCCSLNPKFPKIFIPANLPGHCAASQCSLLGAVIQWHCVSPSVLCGRHAALLSCIHRLPDCGDRWVL